MNAITIGQGKKLAENTTERTKLISGAETLELEAADGTRTIAGAGKLFNGYLGSDYRNWKLDVPSEPTGPQRVDVHEVIQDWTFEHIYGSFGAELDTLCLTQDQIILFVERFRSWLRTDGLGTFFLFKENGEFFVACVREAWGGNLGTNVYSLSGHGRWACVGCHHRFVVPQLEFDPLDA